ncbi:MAG: insulinase family protein, partial [Tunicatimonas sp.]
ALHGPGYRLPFKTYVPQQKTVQRPLTQAQCAIGRTAFPVQDQRSLPFFMLTNLLGGPGMNSRLNLALREKHGLVYSADAEYQSYTDTGFFAIYFGTEPAQLSRAIGYVMKELRTLREKPLGRLQLHRLKEQLMGQIAMSSENNQSLMLAIGRSLLEEREMESLDTIYAKINAVEASDLQDIAQEMFREEELSTLTYVPEATPGEKRDEQTSDAV